MSMLEVSLSRVMIGTGEQKIEQLDAQNPSNTGRDVATLSFKGEVSSESTQRAASRRLSSLSAQNLSNIA